MALDFFAPLSLICHKSSAVRQWRFGCACAFNAKTTLFMGRQNPAGATEKGADKRLLPGAWSMKPGGVESLHRPWIWRMQDRDMLGAIIMKRIVSILIWV
ncbi:hypothetical protein [Vandammella animalimorsus]|uniref:hypothetical protein n=1 Tax=Vandammella animalimorsus TaxID=2029117 RepID=UPI001178AD73|nr:hypothetical protein [Vandammella animalimorsus]